MNSRFLLIPTLAMLMFLLSCGGNPDTFEGGRLYRIPDGKGNELIVAELSGTFRQMGRQYGLMLGPQLRQLYQEAVVEYLVKEKNVSESDLIRNTKDYVDKTVPRIFKDYIEGIGETSGLAEGRQYVISQIFLLVYTGGSGCSSLSVWGNYTPDRNAVVGRNLDLGTSEILMRFANRYFNVVVFNPTGFPASVANLDMIGSLFYQTAINSKGIFLELQNGQLSDPSTADNRKNSNFAVFESLFMNTTPDETDKWFATNLTDGPHIMNASFPDHASIYEWSTFAMLQRDNNSTGEKGILSASNHFIHPDWSSYKDSAGNNRIKTIPSDQDATYFHTLGRLNNLYGLGLKNKGALTPKIMQDIFDTNLSDGGPTFPFDPNSGFMTLYSVVAKPGDLKIWLKIKGANKDRDQGWTEVDLKRYFH